MWCSIHLYWSTQIYRLCHYDKMNNFFISLNSTIIYHNHTFDRKLRVFDWQAHSNFFPWVGFICNILIHDNIANLQVNAECFHFYYIFSHLNVNKTRLHVMKSVSRILATMKSLPIFLFFGFYDDDQFITYLPSWTFCKKRWDCHIKYLP